WELSAVPYIPATRLVAEHARNLSSSKVDGIMLGWTLGGYPSPNVEVMARYSFQGRAGQDLEAPPDIERVLEDTALRRFGPLLAGTVAGAWSQLSQVFKEYPFHGSVVYRCPAQFGPSNLLYTEETHYASTMIGFPYDDLDGWRGVYPPEAFVSQFDRMAVGWAE